MNLTAADVAEIMRLVEQSNFDELNLEIDGVKLVLRRSGARAPAPSPPDTSAALTAAPAAQVVAPVAPAARAAPPAAAPAASFAGATGPGASGPIDANLEDITSPLLGTFYRAPKPGSPPFVEIGSSVEEDSVIAIIEVMKLMNTVRAGVKGMITDILPADETLVEFGEVLMRVRRDG